MPNFGRKDKGQPLLSRAGLYLYLGYLLIRFACRKRLLDCAYDRRGYFIENNAEATAGFEPAIGVLQTPALPLGHVATHKNTCCV